MKLKESLERIIKEEKNADTNKRACAVYQIMFLKISKKDVARMFGVTERTLCNWKGNFLEKGLDGLRSLPRSGRLPDVPADLIMIVAHELFERGVLNPITLIHRICSFTKKRYSLASAKRWLAYFHMTIKSTTSKLVTAATVEKIAGWQKYWISKILLLEKDGWAILIQDEALHFNETKSGKKYYGPVGVRIARPKSPSKERVIVYGSYSTKHFGLFSAHDKFNGASFIRHLKDAYRKFGKFVMILDNSKTHKSKLVKEFLRQMAGKIILVFLPPGAPQLSAMERIFGACKHETLTGEYYESREEMRHTLMEYYRTKRFGQMSVYKFLRTKR